MNDGRFSGQSTNHADYRPLPYAAQSPTKYLIMAIFSLVRLLSHHSRLSSLKISSTSFSHFAILSCHLCHSPSLSSSLPLSLFLSLFLSSLSVPLLRLTLGDHLTWRCRQMRHSQGQRPHKRVSRHGRHALQLKVV